MRVVGTATSNAVLAVDQGLADNAKARVWETAAGAGRHPHAAGHDRSRPPQAPADPASVRGNQDLHPERDRGFASRERCFSGRGGEAVEEEGLQPPGCLVRASVVRQLLCQQRARADVAGGDVRADGAVAQAAVEDALERLVDVRPDGGDFPRLSGRGRRAGGGPVGRRG